MSNTRKKYHGNKHKTQKKSRVKGIGATMEQIKQNRMRNKMIRNIRMGRIRQGGGGSGGGFISQFIGKPWTPDSIGRNFFALSPKGVGTGVVPKFDDGRPLGSARYPTQLGPQVPKLGQAGGSSSGSIRRSRKNIRGGGIIDDITYSFNNLNAKLAGTPRPFDPNPHSQPFLKTSCSV